MQRHLKNVFLAIVGALFLCTAGIARAQETRPATPNIVVILTPGIGYADLGCFGQKMLKTPHLDAMAAEGIRFTQFYAGGGDSTSARRVLLTGRHGGRNLIRNNAAALPADTATVVSALKAAGYAAGSVGDWANAAPAAEDAGRFIRDNQKTPFLLLWSLKAPPAKPDDAGKAIDGISPDWPPAEKAYAAALLHFDREVGQLLALLKELKIDRNTLVIFMSENGPRADDGHKPEFFQSTGKMRGIMGSLNEGGIRIPMIAWWPGTIPAASDNNRQWYAGDLLATVAELAGAKRPDGVDSDSFAPALRGQTNPDQWARKSRLYWQTTEGQTTEAVRFGKWKAMRSPIGTGPVELYDMSNDTVEKRDYSQRRPDLTRHATNLLNSSRE